MVEAEVVLNSLIDAGIISVDDPAEYLPSGINADDMLARLTSPSHPNAQPLLTDFQLRRLKVDYDPGSVKLGEYVLTGEVDSQGAQARTYFARDKGGNQVVIKTPRRVDDHDQSIKRFKGEADNLRRLCHPSVVRCLAFFLDDESPFIVMERVIGLSLLERIRQLRSTQTQAPAEEILGVAVRIARALEHMHSQNILHRDVKSTNIMIRDRNRSAVLVDFGLAKADYDATLTETGRCVGSRRYLHPQFLEQRHTTPVHDLYGLGVSLYELATLDYSPVQLMNRDAVENVVDSDVRQVIELAMSGADNSPARELRTLLEKTAERRSVRLMHNWEIRSSRDNKSNYKLKPDYKPRRRFPQLQGQNTELTHIESHLGKSGSGKSIIVFEGPGGHGKTHSAYQMWRNTKEKFSAGAIWIRLYEDETIEPLLQQVWKGLTTREKPPRMPDDPHERLVAVVELLARNNVLVVLDGFERALQRHKEYAFDNSVANVDVVAFLNEAAQLQSFRSRIVVTERPGARSTAAIKRMSSVEVVKMTGLNADECLALLSTSYHQASKGKSRGDWEVLIRSLMSAGTNFHPLLAKLLAGAIAVFGEAVVRTAIGKLPPLDPVEWISSTIWPILPEAHRTILRVLAATSGPVKLELLKDLLNQCRGSTKRQYLAALDELQRAFLVSSEDTPSQRKRRGRKPSQRRRRGPQVRNTGTLHFTVHELVGDAVWLDDIDANHTLTRRLFDWCVSQRRYDDAYSLLFGRLNPKDYMEKFNSNRREMLTRLFQGEECLIVSPNNRAVALACCASDLLFQGRPHDSINLISHQISVRHDTSYRSHEEKAKTFLAYASYLSGDGTASLQICRELVESRTLTRFWNNSLPEKLLDWLDGSGLRSWDSVSLKGIADAFHNHFSEVSGFELKNSVLQYEAELWVNLVTEHLANDDTAVPSALVPVQMKVHAAALAIADRLNARDQHKDVPPIEIDNHKRVIESLPWLGQYMRNGVSVMEDDLNGHAFNSSARWTETQAGETECILEYDGALIGLAWDEGDYEFAYGGMRTFDFSEKSAIKLLLDRLHVYESRIKNRLINLALAQDCLVDISHRLPKGFANSVVGGARCIFRLSGKSSADVDLQEILLEVGNRLEHHGGRIKLTPDFGHRAGVADDLFKHTDHVLGIRCEAGGCGSKSSYTAAGIVALLRSFNVPDRVTIVGHKGSLGREVLRSLQDKVRDLGVCDLQGTDGSAPGIRRLPATEVSLSETAVAQGGVIITCANGDELARTPSKTFDMLVSGDIILLAQNMAIAPCTLGRETVRRLHQAGVVLWPGQVATLGGALAARFEWYSRLQETPSLNKELLYDAIRKVVTQVAQLVKAHSLDKGIPLYEAMCELAGVAPYQYDESPEFIRTFSLDSTKEFEQRSTSDWAIAAPS